MTAGSATGFGEHQPPDSPPAEGILFSSAAAGPTLRRSISFLGYLVTMRPTKGQRYRARFDLEVIGVISFAAPFTSGFQGTFPKGATATVAEDPPSFARGVYLRPDDYEHFERLFVPEAERGDQKYSHYSVVATFDALLEQFDLVDRAG